MARGDSKINVWVIVRDHRASYVDVRSGQRRVRDHLLIEGLPVLALGLLLPFGPKLSVAAAGGLLTVSFLLSALFFGLMLQMSERAMTWADSGPPPGPATSRHGVVLGELAAHAGYASLVSILAAIAYVVASIVSGWPLRVASAVGIALGLHLMLVLFMVMKRVYLVTLERLNRARTGAAASSPPSGRRAS